LTTCSFGRFDAAALGVTALFATIALVSFLAIRAPRL